MPRKTTHRHQRPLRSRRPRLRALLLSGALAVGLLAGTSGAQARQITTPDPLGGGSSAFDLHRVKVVNHAKGVRIVVRMSPVDWEESSPVGEFRLLLDTKAASRGAEFADEVGIPGDGGFRALKGSARHRRSWTTYPFPGKCGKTVRERYDLEAGKVTISIKPKRGCLWHPRYVRVNVRTIQSGHIEGDEFVENTPPLVDHLPYKKRFTPWVKYSKK